MSTDIIQISIDDFMANKECEATSRTVDRIKSIVEKYSCFHESIGTSKPGSNDKARPFNNRGHLHPMQSQRPRPPKQISFERDALALLNKLSNKNKDVVVPRIVRLCAQYDDCSKVVDHVLFRGYKFGQYKELLADILQEIGKRYNIESQINTSVESFVEMFAIRLSEMQDEPPVSNYDAFCAYIKEKEKLLTTLQLMLIVSKRLGKMNKFESLWPRLYVIHETLSQSSADTFVDVIKLLNAYGIRTPNAIDLYKSLQGRYNLGMKTIFKWRDVLSLQIQ